MSKLNVYNKALIGFYESPELAGYMANRFHLLQNTEYKRALRDFYLQYSAKINVEFSEQCDKVAQ